MLDSIAFDVIDGRYSHYLGQYSNYFNEYSLQKYRLEIEIRYFIFLSTHLKNIQLISNDEKLLLFSIIENFNENEFQKIKTIENTIHHDVKAIEYYLKDILKSTSLVDRIEMIHWGVTSEDITNLAILLMLREGLNVFKSDFSMFFCRLLHIANKHKRSIMVSRTHGQIASPTTFGKELVVHVNRLYKNYIKLQNLQLEGKLNGSNGNYNAFCFADSDVDWIQFSREFIEGELGFKCNLYTTQIENHDSLNDLFIIFLSINNILKDLCFDLWFYISQGYIVQKKREKEIGSSVMPHKINPWRLESCEGLLNDANFKLFSFINKLQVSKLQRDLSDHVALRNIGVPILYCVVAIKIMEEQLQRIRIDKEKMFQEVMEHAEVLAEGIQTLERVNNDSFSYEEIRKVVVGKQMNKQQMEKCFENNKMKEKIEQFPNNYIGLSEKLVEEFIKNIK